MLICQSSLGISETQAIITLSKKYYTCPEKQEHHRSLPKTNLCVCHALLLFIWRTETWIKLRDNISVDTFGKYFLKTKRKFWKHIPKWVVQVDRFCLLYPLQYKLLRYKNLSYPNQVLKVIASPTFQSCFQLNGQDIRERNYHFHLFSIFM